VNKKKYKSLPFLILYKFHHYYIRRVIIDCQQYNERNQHEERKIERRNHENFPFSWGDQQQQKNSKKGGRRKTHNKTNNLIVIELKRF
jgi:hypothetical protein